MLTEYLNVTSTALPKSFANEYATEDAQDHANTGNQLFLLTLSPKLSYIMKFLVAIQTVVVVAGIMGNVLSIRTFYRMGLKDSVTITFFSLAISDLGFLLVYIIDLALKFFHIVVSDKAQIPTMFGMNLFELKSLVWKAYNTFILASMFTITFLAVQRSLCVIRPLHFKGMFTRVRTFIVLSVIWGYCLMFTTIHFSALRITKTWIDQTNSSIYFVAWHPLIPFLRKWTEDFNGIFISTVSPILVMGGLVIMAHALRNSVRFRQAASSSGVAVNQLKDTPGFGGLQDCGAKDKTDAVSKINNSSSKERQAIIQVAIVSAFFLVAFAPAPFLILAMYIKSMPFMFPFTFSRELFEQTYVIFVLINASINFLVYFRFNTKFKQVLLKAKE